MVWFAGIYPWCVLWSICDKRYSFRGIPLRALNTFAWRSQFSWFGRGLHVGNGKTLQGQREAFARKVINSLFKYFTRPIEVQERFEMDLFWYRTCGEMELAIHLMDVEDEQLENWRIPDWGGVTVSNDAYLSGRPQLRSAFRYGKRMSEPRRRNYWSEQVRH